MLLFFNDVILEDAEASALLPLLVSGCLSWEVKQKYQTGESKRNKIKPKKYP